MDWSSVEFGGKLWIGPAESSEANYGLERRRVRRQTMDWTSGEFRGKIGGIRRHEPSDWDCFCDPLHKAHERDVD